MKFFILLVFALSTVSSFASTIECDVYNNTEIVDTLRLGNVRLGVFSQAKMKKINGVEGMLVGIELPNAKTVSIQILEGFGPYDSKELLSVKGSIAEGLTASLSQKGITVICTEKD